METERRRLLEHAGRLAGRHEPDEGGEPGRHRERCERSLPASETLSYTLGPERGNQVQIEKRYTLRTNERQSGAPTVDLSGDLITDTEAEIRIAMARQ